MKNITIDSLISKLKEGDIYNDKTERVCKLLYSTIKLFDGLDLSNPPDNELIIYSNKDGISKAIIIHDNGDIELHRISEKSLDEFDKWAFIEYSKISKYLDFFLIDNENNKNEKKY